MAYLRPANRVVRPLPRTTRRPPPRAVDPLLLQSGQVAAYRYMPQFAGLERLQTEAAGTRDQAIANATAMAAGIAAAAEKARPALAEVYKQAQQQVEDSTDGISKHLGKGQSGHLFNKLSAESQAESIGALSAGGALTQGALIDRTNNAQTQAAFARTAAQRQYAGDLAKIQQTRQDVGAEQGQFLDVTYSQLRGERAKATAQARKDAMQQAYQNAQLGQGNQRLRLTAASQRLTARGQTLAHQDRMYAATHAKPRSGGAGGVKPLTPAQSSGVKANIDRAYSVFYTKPTRVWGTVFSDLTRGRVPGVGATPLQARAARELAGQHALNRSTAAELRRGGFVIPRPWRVLTFDTRY